MKFKFYFSYQICNPQKFEGWPLAESDSVYFVSEAPNGTKGTLSQGVEVGVPFQREKLQQ